LVSPFWYWLTWVVPERAVKRVYLAAAAAAAAAAAVVVDLYPERCD